MHHPVNILLVDDEPRNLDSLESFLHSSDYGLVRALTAEQALLLLLEGEFAAIVLDFQMPGMNGIELAALIKQRKRTQHIPIIFLTAYYQEDKDVLQGYGSGAVDYLTKPVNPQILKSKIGVFVDLFRKTRALAAANATLELEVAQRQKAEEALRIANNALEERVQARTADLIRVNDELRRSEEQAKSASRAKDDFLATLSHELRTPLNPVLLIATEAASNPDLPPDVRQDFETIARNVRLEARLIDDLLDLTRIVHGKFALEMRPFDLHSSIEHALAMTVEDIEEKQIELTLDLKAERSVVLGDDVRLKQVFWNVLKNAAKFTPQRGQITVQTTLTENGRDLVVRISDTGIGMTPAELARIFEAFSQGDHAHRGRPHRFGGVGLGLAISRMMLELHSGSIRAFSEGRDRGTTFVITLPLLREAAAGTTSATVAPEIAHNLGSQTPLHAGPVETRPGFRRVLLVEDHKPTAVALEALLRRRRYEVVSAGTLAEARDAARAGLFDILISDIGLPDGSGNELMEEMRHRPGLLGIALTGYGMEEDVNRSQAAGFAAHLTKPVSVQSLERALATPVPVRV